MGWGHLVEKSLSHFCSVSVPEDYADLLTQDTSNVDSDPETHVKQQSKDRDSSNSILFTKLGSHSLSFG